LKKPPRDTPLRVNSIIEAWQTLCPEESFFGHTLDQYKEEVKPIFEVRAEATEIDRRWTSVMVKRQDVDTAANALSKNIVRSVRAHPKYGEDSGLYATMGFTRESARRRRGRREAKPATREAAPVTETS
jgi:hypothetical protein